MGKQSELLALTKLRQSTRYPGYKCIGDYHSGAYESDFVSPYTKTAGNVDAEIMVMLQDWASDGVLSKKLHEPSVSWGHEPSLPTNRNLIRLLNENFGLHLQDVYGTNLFPFIKLGGMSTSIRRADLNVAALPFALPQIHIVDPKLVICLGLVTFNALRQACNLRPCPNMHSAIENPFNIGSTRVWCQAHTGAFGQNNRNRGGVNRVSDDWREMKADIGTTGNRATHSSRVQRAVEAPHSDRGRRIIRVAKDAVKSQKSNVSVQLSFKSSQRQTIVYLNNCQGKNHSLYGKDAFYDLWATDSRAPNLSAGQECIVAACLEDWLPARRGLEFH